MWLTIPVAEWLDPDTHAVHVVVALGSRIMGELVETWEILEKYSTFPSC